MDVVFSTVLSEGSFFINNPVWIILSFFLRNSVHLKPVYLCKHYVHLYSTNVRYRMLVQIWLLLRSYSRNLLCKLTHIYSSLINPIPAGLFLSNVCCGGGGGCISPTPSMILPLKLRYGSVIHLTLVQLFKACSFKKKSL